MALSHAPIKKVSFKEFLKSYPLTGKQTLKLVLFYFIPIIILLIYIVKIKNIVQPLGTILRDVSNDLGINYGLQLITISIGFSIIFFLFYLKQQHALSKNYVLSQKIHKQRQALHDYFVDNHLRRSVYEKADKELKDKNGIKNHYVFTFWTTYLQVFVFTGLLGITKFYTPMTNSYFLGQQLGSKSFLIALFGSGLWAVSSILTAHQSRSQKTLSWISVIISSFTIFGLVALTSYGVGIYMITISIFNIIKQLIIKKLRTKWETNYNQQLFVTVTYKEIIKGYGV